MMDAQRLVEYETAFDQELEVKHLSEYNGAVWDDLGVWSNESEQLKLFNEFVALKDQLQYLASIVQNEETVVTQKDLDEFKMNCESFVSGFNNLVGEVYTHYQTRMP